MGGCSSKRRTKRKDSFSLVETDGADTPPVVELAGEELACRSFDEIVVTCRGLVEHAHQLRLLSDEDCDVKLGHGAFWLIHVYHATLCVKDDEEYSRAALEGLQRWQKFAQHRPPRLSRYPF